MYDFICTEHGIFQQNYQNSPTKSHSTLLLYMYFIMSLCFVLSQSKFKQLYSPSTDVVHLVSNTGRWLSKP